MPLFPFKRRRTPAIPPGRRVYAIGDVHGRLDLFAALLDRLAADDRARGRADTLVIQLGDLIDRGPASATVVRLAMQPLEWGQLRVLKGNHEAAMIEAMGGDRTMLSMWLKNGGVAAIASWGVDPALADDPDGEALLAALDAAVPRAERAWLARCPLSIDVGGYHFVHAGVRPGVALDAQSEADCLWIRDPFLESTRDHGAMIVHGHTVTEAIDERPNRIGIDTGAYASGILTALGLEDAERWFIQTGTSAATRARPE